MSFNRKINSNKQTFDLIYFRGKSHFKEDGAQNYLVFQNCTDIFKRILVLSMVNIFTFGNLKACRMKVLILLLHLITLLL